MTGASRRQRIQALLFAAIMVVSMVAAGIGGGLAGSAVAQPNATLVVDDDFDNPDESTNFSSIQDAVDVAAENGSIATIEVHEGTYEESVTIDTQGLTLQGADDASSTIIGQSSIAVTSTAPNVEIADLRIENPDGSRAVRVTGDATGVVIQNNTVTNVNTNNSADQPRGIVVGGLDDGDSADGLEIRNNTVTNVEGADADREQAQAIQILEQSKGGGLIENVIVDGNTVENILDTRSTVGIDFNGNIEGTITDNDISGLNTEGNPGNVTFGYTDADGFANESNAAAGFTVGIRLTAGDDAASPPQNVTISGNEISSLETTERPNFQPANHIRAKVNNAEDVDIRNNNLTAAQRDDGAEIYIVGPRDLDMSSVADANSFNGNVVIGDPAISNNIQVQISPLRTDGSAENRLVEPGDTIEIQPGTYIEEVEIDKPLTLESEGTAAETTIRLTQEEASSTGAPTVDILSPGVTVDGFTVQRNSTDENVAQGIRVSNGSESGDTVVVSNNIVENLNTTRSVDNGILVGDNNNGDTPANVIVRSNTVSEFPNGIGVTSKTSDKVVRNVTIRNNTLYDNGVGFGVSNVSGAGVESIEATQNNITQNSVGVYLFGNENAGRLSFTDVNASEVSVNTNNIIDNTGEVPDPEGGVMSVPSSIVNNGANELDATLNYYGKSTTPNTSSAVRYDPVLTTSIENISTDSTSDIRQYGSYLELSSDDGSPIAVGFAAPPDGNASEVLGDVVDVPSTVYRYNNTADEFVSIDGSYTPSTGEVLVIAPQETLNDETIIPIATGSETAARPDSVDLTQGWNLVATGATNDPSGIAVADGGADGVINDASLQVQPAQPGAPSANTGAFEGTWLFVDADGQLFTGYTEDQSPSTYSEEVLEPDTDKTE